MPIKRLLSKTLPTGRTFREEIGWRVWDLRKEARMTQQNVADATGISRPSIANIEAGRQEVQLKTLRDLARLFDIDYRDFLPEDKWEGK